MIEEMFLDRHVRQMTIVRRPRKGDWLVSGFVMPPGSSAPRARRAFRGEGNNLNAAISAAFSEAGRIKLTPPRRQAKSKYGEMFE